jgi:hypothetical protein
MSSTPELPRLPIKEFKAGGVKAAIWRKDVEQDGRTFARYSVRIQKSYRDKAGDWQVTQYYEPRDLPLVALLANKAFEFISLKESQDAPDDENLPL